MIALQSSTSSQETLLISIVVFVFVTLTVVAGIWYYNSQIIEDKQQEGNGGEAVE